MSRDLIPLAALLAVLAIAGLASVLHSGNRKVSAALAGTTHPDHTGQEN